jgi:hypothetical protein
MFEEAEAAGAQWQFELMSRDYSSSLIILSQPSNDKDASGTGPLRPLFVNLIPVPLPVVVRLPLACAVPKILNRTFEIVVACDVS